MLLMLVNLIHAILVTSWGHVHPRHHTPNIQGIQWIVLVL